jgi:hypothetical protein
MSEVCGALRERKQKNRKDTMQAINSQSDYLGAGHAPKKQSRTRYALHFVRGQYADAYVSSFTQYGWLFDHDLNIFNAYKFDSATQAWCVAFCLMIDHDCEVVPVDQMELFDL